MRTLFIILIIFIISLTACEKIATLFTEKKSRSSSNFLLATQAQNYFWNTLHQGKYDQIDQAIFLLTAAYLQNPHDPTLASHLGFLHIWKITERAREKQIPPTIVNEIILAKKYFSDSYQLDPHDARILGFLGDSELVEGTIFQDPQQQVHGYFMLQDAIRQWPEFNLFTAGFVMSDLSANSKNFKEALAWQWKTLDLCAGEKVNRDNPDYTPYMKLETQTGPKRACWNSWIAPHNFEGFFMNMGDMLVKSGDVAAAQKIYRNAMLSKTYESWPYKNELLKRIAHPDKKNMLFNSGYGCAACHQVTN